MLETIFNRDSFIDSFVSEREYCYGIIKEAIIADNDCKLQLLNLFSAEVSSKYSYQLSGACFMGWHIDSNRYLWIIVKRGGRIEKWMLPCECCLFRVSKARAIIPTKSPRSVGAKLIEIKPTEELILLNGRGRHESWDGTERNARRNAGDGGALLCLTI